jgi:hypothetical protein
MRISRFVRGAGALGICTKWADSAGRKLAGQGKQQEAADSLGLAADVARLIVETNKGEAPQLVRGGRGGWG